MKKPLRASIAISPLRNEYDLLLFDASGLSIVSETTGGIASHVGTGHSIAAVTARQPVVQTS